MVNHVFDLYAMQMHLGCDPYVIVVLVKQTEAKKIAKQLSHKLHLDTDFFQPKSEDASERYIILQLDDTPPPEHIVTINEVSVYIRSLQYTPDSRPSK